jgi:hypothetical protein
MCRFDGRMDVEEEKEKAERGDFLSEESDSG